MLNQSWCRVDKNRKVPEKRIWRRYEIRVESKEDGVGEVYDMYFRQL